MSIDSKLHRMMELAPHHPSLHAAKKLPFFVYHRELQGLFSNLVLQKSVYELLRAGVGHLPFPMLATEVWAGLPWRALVIISEVEYGKFHATVTEYVSDSVAPYDMEVDITAQGLEHFESCSYKVDWNDHVYYENRFGKDRSDLIMHVVAALNLALIGSHMPTVEKIRVEAPEKLNRARARSGKPGIPEYTICRLGHVYDSSGRKIPASTARTMPIHVRSGYVRQQPHGSPWIAAHPDRPPGSPGVTETHHLEFIPPVLVNYKPDEPIRPRLVKL